MSKIKKVIGREVIDSRGYPTVEAEVYLDNNIYGRAIVPSGASTGSNEALELRDNDLNRYLGKGVLKSVFIINNIISKEIIGLDVLDQKNIDNIMINFDGTKNKSKLGANSILAVSLAVSKAASKYLNIPLYEYISKLIDNKKFYMPTPMVNIINGGCHSDNNIDIQEFMIIPVNANSFRHSIRICCEIFHNLGKILKSKNKRISVGDEGGYAPDLSSNEEALSLISESIDKSGYILGKDVYISLDCAASEFYDEKKKLYFFENKYFTFYELTDYFKKIINKYSIISIEDPLSESDWDGYSYLTSYLGDKVQIVGDDLFVTNVDLIKKGINLNIANAVLIKLNQIGTLTETLEAVKLSQQNNYSVIISHRSGETEDTFIADLSIGVCSGQIKTGSVSRSDRISKYNRLIRIEDNFKKIVYGKYLKSKYFKK